MEKGEGSINGATNQHADAETSQNAAGAARAQEPAEGFPVHFGSADDGIAATEPLISGEGSTNAVTAQNTATQPALAPNDPTAAGILVRFGDGGVADERPATAAGAATPLEPVEGSTSRAASIQHTESQPVEKTSADSGFVSARSAGGSDIVPIPTSEIAESQLELNGITEQIDSWLQEARQGDPIDALSEIKNALHTRLRSLHSGPVQQETTQGNCDASPSVPSALVTGEAPQSPVRSFPRATLQELELEITQLLTELQSKVETAQQNGTDVRKIFISAFREIDYCINLAQKAIPASGESTTDAHLTSELAQPETMPMPDVEITRLADVMDGPSAPASSQAPGMVPIDYNSMTMMTDCQVQGRW